VTPKKKPDEGREVEGTTVDQHFKDLLEASTLGTPAVRRIRSLTSMDVVDDVRRRMVRPAHAQAKVLPIPERSLPEDVQESRDQGVDMGAGLQEPDLAVVFAQWRQGRPSPETALSAAYAVIVRFNEADSANEELYEKARRASDAASRARAEAWEARDALRTAQLEHPERRWRLPLMSLIALVLFGCDSFAAFVTAQTFGLDQPSSLMMAAMLLAILGGLEVGLAWFAQRNRTAFRLLAFCLGTFTVLLGFVRFASFAATGAGTIAAMVGAALFATSATVFVIGGYAALRYTETLTIWQARRHARMAERKAAKAEVEATGVRLEVWRPMTCGQRGLIRGDPGGSLHVA
jgi:hypothetical protein